MSFSSRKSGRTWFVLGVGMVIVGLVLSACATPTPERVEVEVTKVVEKEVKVKETVVVEIDQRRGGTVRVGLATGFENLDPMVSSAWSDRVAAHAIYDPLVDLDENLNIVPMLAKSWEISDDGRTYTFHLQEGVKFHDGTDFNAEAVKFNFENILDPDVQSTQRADMSVIESMEAIDEHTIAITLKHPFAPFLSVLTDRAGMIRSPAAVQKFGEDYTRNPVGTGPFKLGEWVKDDHLTVERNENYWREGLPYLDRVVFRVIPDSTARLTALRTGDIDILDEVAPKDIATLKRDQNLVYREVPGLGFEMIRINTTAPPFDNVACRQALAYAIDREALLQSVFFSTGAEGRGSVPPTSWAWSEGVKGIDYDPDMVRQKLEECGKPDGYDFEMIIWQRPLDQTLGQAVQAMAGDFGINVKLTTMEVAAGFARIRADDFQAGQSWWSGRVDPDGNLYRHFHSSAIEGGNNFMNFSHDEIDELLEAQREVANPEERKKIIAEAEQMIIDQVPMVFYHFIPIVRAHSQRMQDYVQQPDGMMRFETVWIAGAGSQ
ncbi:MAG: ABC transporter substrate-binding protein [Anaerolineae bacterium]